MTVAKASINLRFLKNILEQLISLGITEAVIEPIVKDGEDYTQVRAGNKDHSILIFDQIEGKLSEKALAVSSTNGLLSRLSLFNEDKSSVTVLNGSSFVSSIEIKEGKRKATYTMSQPQLILAPRQMPKYEILGEEIKFSKEFIDQLLDVFSSMSYTGKRENRKISFKSGKGELNITISDGESDSFSESFAANLTESDIPTTQWELDAFKMAMKKSSECNVDKSVSFVITDIGTAILTAAPLSVIVAPVH